LSRFVRFEGYQVDLQTGELRKNGTKVRLSGQSFQILALLLERPGELISREELRTKLWPDEVFVDFDHSLNAAVNKLREALCDSTSDMRFIETLPKRGYRFIGSIETRDKPATLQGALVPPGPAPTAPSNRLNRLHITLKHALALSVLVLAGLLTGLYVYRRRSHTPSGNVVPAIHSIAVLPLKNLSGDPAQEYFAEGMTEEIIGRLSMIRGLRVISRTSAMHFKDTRAPLSEIVKALGVDAMVEGSVKREGSRVRVHAQLIRAATDEHFWSETYDRELGDALGLESDVAQTIAGRVEVTVTGEEHTRLTADRSVSPEVYENYLRGRFALANKGNNRAGIDESIGFFEEAIARDPTFAPAYVSLANAHAHLSTVFIGAPPAMERAQVESAARKALELDPELAEAHALLAARQQEQWHWTEAEAEYKRALELDWSEAAAYGGLALWLISHGRTEEALAWVRRGRELDPFAVSGTDVAWVLFLARRHDEAMRELRSVQAVQPNDARNLWVLGFVLIANNQPQEAIPVLEKALSVSNHSPGVIGVLVRACAHAGRRTDALGLLAELKRRKQAGFVPAAAFVNAYLGLGENEEAYAWLEQAYKEQSNILQWLKVHPYFDPLRDDPRFKDLLRRVGLDQAR